MNKINLSGVTSETVTGILILLVSLVNAIFQIFGINILPIENEEVSTIVSIVFLIGTTLYNTWKNRNLTQASQIAQNITDSIKNGEIPENDVKQMIEIIKSNKWMDCMNGNNKRTI